MDNKGRVTVVLHWDQRQGQSGGAGPPNDKFSPSKKGLSAQSSIDKSSPAPQRYPSPQITVINHDDPSNLYHSGILLPSPPPPPQEAAELTLREFFLFFQVRISDVSPKVVDRSIVLLELSIYIRQNVLIMLIHQQWVTVQSARSEVTENNSFAACRESWCHWMWFPLLCITRRGPKDCCT